MLLIFDKERKYEGSSRRRFLYTNPYLCDQHLPLLARSVQLGNSLLRSSTSCIPPPGIFPQVLSWELRDRRRRTRERDKFIISANNEQNFFKKTKLYTCIIISLSHSLCVRGMWLWNDMPPRGRNRKAVLYTYIPQKDPSRQPTTSLVQSTHSTSRHEEEKSNNATREEIKSAKLLI